MNLIEGIQKEQERCRKLLEMYESIPTGGFGSQIIRLALAAADRSVATGDTIAMMQAYENLKSCE